MDTGITAGFIKWHDICPAAEKAKISRGATAARTLKGCKKLLADAGAPSSLSGYDTAGPCNQELVPTHANESPGAGRVSEELSVPSSQGMKLRARIAVGLLRIPGAPLFYVLAVEEHSQVGAVGRRQLSGVIDAGASSTCAFFLILRARSISATCRSTGTPNNCT